MCPCGMHPLSVGWSETRIEWKSLLKMDKNILPRLYLSKLLVGVVVEMAAVDRCPPDYFYLNLLTKLFGG